MAGDTAQDTKQRTVSYVYGIVPADVESNDDARGIGDPPSPITLVRHGEIAAMVSEFTPDERPLGEPADLTTHANVLDSVAGEIPVLPLRFGAVLDSQDAVAEQLLAAHHDEFADALRQLEGHAQYVLRGRYDEQAILNEVLSENPDAARLRESVRNKPADAAREDRLALGELIANGIAAKRDADTRQVVEVLGPLDGTLTLREPSHERDAVHVAILLEVARQAELEELAGRIAEAWSERVEFRLLGPLAAYDFVIARS